MSHQKGRWGGEKQRRGEETKEGGERRKMGGEQKEEKGIATEGQMKEKCERRKLMEQKRGPLKKGTG